MPLCGILNKFLDIMTWWFSTTGAVASVAWWITLASILEYFHLGWEVAAIFAALIVFDFIFWISDAYIKDKQQVTSAKMWRWLAKKLSKMMLPLIVVLVLRWVWFESLEMVVTTIMSILIITEGYSIIWHIYSINTWETLSEIDAFSLLLDFIIGIFKQKLPMKEEKKVEEETKTEEE